MQVRPYLYQCHVPPDKLRETVEALGSLDLLYFESEQAIELEKYRAPDTAWQHGRAFNTRLEVRWQRAGDGFDLLLLTEAELPSLPGWQPVPENDDNIPCPDSADPPGQVLLWGTHISQLQRPHYLAGGKDDAWIETRIPRALRYPVSGSPHWVKARVIVYRCQGRPVLTRWVGIEGEEHEPRPQ